jgi:hypothetical protein
MPNAYDLVQEAKGIFAVADAEGRSLTASECVEVEGFIDTAKSQKNIEAIGKSLGAPGFSAGATDAGGDPGSRFIQSEQYLKAKSASNRGASWSTGPVAVGMMTKGTVAEGAGSPGSGTGGGLVPVPQMASGIVQMLAQPPVVENLLLSAQATGNTVRFAYEGTATSAACGSG